jgi:hypothetical protein
MPRHQQTASNVIVPAAQGLPAQLVSTARHFDSIGTRRPTTKESSTRNVEE